MKITRKTSQLHTGAGLTHLLFLWLNAPTPDRAHLLPTLVPQVFPKLLRINTSQMLPAFQQSRWTVWHWPTEINKNFWMESPRLLISVKLLMPVTISIRQPSFYIHRPLPVNTNLLSPSSGWRRRGYGFKKNNHTDWEKNGTRIPAALGASYLGPWAGRHRMILFYFSKIFSYVQRKRRL